MAPRDRDDAMTGLLRRSLSDGAAAQTECLAPDILAAYFERSLDADETARCELHLSQCARCREQLVALVRADESGAAAGNKLQAAKARFWLLDWRWLAPVAAALVIAAIWFARRPASTPTQPALVAMNQATKAPAQESGAPMNAPPAAVPPAKATPAARENLNVAREMTPPSLAKSVPNAGNTDSSIALGGRSLESQDKVAQPANLQALKSAKSSGNAITSTNETVMVESAPATPAVSAASSQPAAAPAQQQANGRFQAGTGVGYGSGAGVAGGVISSAQQAKQAQAPALMRGYSAAQRVTVKEETRAEQLIRTPDPKIQWRIASGGFVERTEDGGATWQGQLPDASAHLVAGSAPGPKICWLVGDAGIILLTRDAATWEKIPPPANADLIGIIAQDSYSAIVTAADGRKFTTVDRGKTWTPVQ